jgi:hypothetical protein
MQARPNTGSSLSSFRAYQNVSSRSFNAIAVLEELRSLQSSVQLFSQSVRCLERAEITDDKRLAAQLVDLSEQLHHEE